MAPGLVQRGIFDPPTSGSGLGRMKTKVRVAQIEFFGKIAHQ
jgi:hypothetical protein